MILIHPPGDPLWGMETLLLRGNVYFYKQRGANIDGGHSKHLGQWT